MKRPLLIGVILAVLQTASLTAATVYTRASGNWTSTSVWSYTDGGASCGCTPTGADVVYIRHVVNLNKHLTNGSGTLGAVTGSLNILPGGILSGSFFYDMDVRSGGSLYVCGWLLIRNLSFYNGSSVNVCASGNLLVNGSFNNRNNSDNVRIDGSMTILGSYTNGNGGIISGSGTIVVFFGPVSNPGDTYGCVNTNPCSSFPCSIQSPCGGTLAVSWVGFTAVPEGDSVQLAWTTASEEGSVRFVVQRSLDGVHFEDRASMAASGYSSAQQHYSTRDGELPEGWVYYRIREDAVVGEPSYSEVVAVRLAGSSEFTLLTDPVSGRDPQLLTASESALPMQFRLTDLFGNLVGYWEVPTEKDKTRYPVSTDLLNQTGIYVLTVTQGPRTFYGRFFYAIE